MATVVLSARRIIMSVRQTYVADVDDRARVGAGSGEVGEWVWRSSDSWRFGLESAAVVSCWWAAIAASAISSSTTAESASKSATSSTISSSKAATSSLEAAAISSAAAAHVGATTTAEATASSTTEAGATSEAVLANLESTALPVVAVELLNRVLSVLRVVECDDTGALRTSIGSEVHVSANDRACDRYM